MCFKNTVSTILVVMTINTFSVAVLFLFLVIPALQAAQRVSSAMQVSMDGRLSQQCGFGSCSEQLQAWRCWGEFRLDVALGLPPREVRLSRAPSQLSPCAAGHLAAEAFRMPEHGT